MSDRELRKRYYKTILRLCKPLRFKVAITLFFVVVLVGLTASLTLVAQNVIDNVSKGETSGLLGVFLLSGCILLAFAVVQTVVNHLGNYVSFLAGVKVRNYLYKKILEMNNLSKFSSADLMSRAYDESTDLPEYLVYTRYALCLQLLELIVFFSILVYVSWIVALIVAVVIPLLTVLLHVFNSKMSKNRIKYNKSKAVSQETFLQTYSGFGILKLLRSEKYLQNKYSQRLKLEFKFYRQVSKYNSYWQTAAAVVHSTLPVVLAVMTVYFYHLGIVSGLGAVMAVYMTSSNLMGPINNCIAVFQTKVLADKSFERIKPLLIEDERHFGKEAITQVDKVEVAIDKFSYDDKVMLLKDFRLELNSGDAVCVVGESGSGKSTLLRLMLNVQQAEFGSIKINGIELRELERESYYKMVGFVEQAPFLFKQTLRENIELGDRYSEEEMREVIDDCGLQDYVAKYGLEAMVDEKNENISGGQLQRACLARTLIRKPKLILLDEPTASLDGETAKSIVSGILEYVKQHNLMLLCVSHDKNIIDMFDSKVHV